MQLRNYKIGEIVGSGSTASVHRATQTTSNEPCALKIVKTEENERFDILMHNEIQVLKTLSHANIIRCIGSKERATMHSENGEKLTVSYVAMEMASNGELFDFIAGHSGLPEPVLRVYAKQLLTAVHYMHTMGIVHRDLKCENILLDKNFNLKIADFGLACKLQGRKDSGFSNEHVGTRSYMAPELIMRGMYQPYMVDLYAVGVILFMLATGYCPFQLASLDDGHFRLLATHRYQDFWDAHTNSTRNEESDSEPMP